MKRAALGLLCLLVLVPVSAFADSLDSIAPSSFYSFELEQTATLHGVNLFGDFYGAPDSQNILLSTHLVIDGPAGTFNEDISGGFRAPNTTNDTIYMAIPDLTLLVEGHYSVTVVATDDVGQRLIGPVFYDVVPRVIQQNPLLSIPETIFAEATSAAGANVTFDVGGTSFVDPPPAPTVTCDHHSGDLFPLGETIVHCTATDSFGSASGSFPVIVFDGGRPVVTVPGDIVTGNPVVTFTASATDVIDGNVPVSCSPASGSTFNLGTTRVTCIAYDSQGNAGIGTFNVTVSNGPVLTLPPNITAEATSAGGATVSYTVTATDSATISCSPPSGSLFGLGTTTVNCTATASTGTNSGSFLVTVVDTTPPVLTLPANIIAEATSPGGAAVSYTATSTDIVDASPPVTCDHPAGSTFPLGTTTVQCTATDTHNNTAHGSFTVLIRDTTPPVIVKITASPEMIWPPNDKMVLVTISVIATDAVDNHPVSHIVSVSSNEQGNQGGGNNQGGNNQGPPKWQITGPLTVLLRAENDNNRVYTITIETTDFSGNTTQGTINVPVKNPRGHAAAH